VNPLSLGGNVVLLLGEEDNDPNHEELLKTPEAEAQGPPRFARGKTAPRSWQPLGQYVKMRQGSQEKFNSRPVVPTSRFRGPLGQANNCKI
jgi:hypothetical protein